MAEKTTYNGYKNHATWCVNLWLNNSEGDEAKWSERAKKLAEESNGADVVKRDVWTQEQWVKFTMADELKTEFDEANPVGDQPSVWSDLMRSSLDDVDWIEVASSFMDDIEYPENES